MKIATWNIERLKHKSKLNEINLLIEKVNADILVLTETDTRITTTKYKNRIETPKLFEIEPSNYSQTENRVTILTNYEIVKQFETYDKYTSLCVELKTEFGNIKIFGTIIGISGNRNENFKIDLKEQIKNFKKLSTENNLCVIGDYNISFADSYYFTKQGKEELNTYFIENNMELLTREIPECIDHISISTKIIENTKSEIDEWNIDKKLSDHKGIFVNLIKK